MEIKVLLFGEATERVGTSELIALDFSTVSALKQWLISEYPILDNFQFSVAVNKEIIQEDIVLKDQDEVAILPPFSGG